MKIAALAFMAMLGLSSIAHAQTYDLVIKGGRVMDPETKLNAVRNVGIKDGRIVTGTDISAALAETLIRAVQDEC